MSENSVWYGDRDRAEKIFDAFSVQKFSYLDSFDRIYTQQPESQLTAEKLHMIVNLIENGWEVIYHRAHALLAAQLGGHWRKKNSPERLYETLAAISHHDDLAQEWQGNQLTPTGAPLDFRLSSSDSFDELEKLVENAHYRGRWVTLLTSKHVCFLTQDKQGQSPEWDQFLNRQMELQQDYRQQLEISEEDAERAYQFMQWCDRFSLILAQREIPEDGRSLEITSGIDGQRYDVRELEDGHLTVEPWPFEDEKFTVNIEACYLSELKYESSEALIAAMQQAPIQVLEWTFTQVSSQEMPEKMPEKESVLAGRV